MATNFLGPIGKEWPSRYRTDVQDCGRCGIEIRKNKGGLCTDCIEADPDFVAMSKERRAS